MYLGSNLVKFFYVFLRRILLNSPFIIGVSRQQMNKLNDILLQDRIHHFFGYGQYASDYWFIGMEEGGGNTRHEVDQRLNRWSELSRPELIDNYEFHRNVDSVKGGKQESYARFFTGKRELQKTWKMLIRTLLNIQNPNQQYTKEDIRHYQSQCWGRSNANNCLLDIFPLPSPDSSAWHYHEWSELPFLATKALYKRQLRSMRITALRERIARYAPKVVLFYSQDKKEYMPLWAEIIGDVFEKKEQVWIQSAYNPYFVRAGETQFIITAQPSCVRNNEYWNKVGAIAHRLLAGEN
jgi:hypothetical protein